MKIINIIIISLIVVLFNSCATIKNPPISNSINKLDMSKGSIGFLTLKVSNNKNKIYQPEISYAFIWDDKIKDRNKYSIRVNEPFNSTENEFNEYIISFQLDKGEYVFRELSGQAGSFPISGIFSILLFKKISMPKNKILYFGHINAKVVNRIKENDLRAGPVFPLINQSITGASTGTFKIDIVDNYEADVALIKNRYKYLSNKIIENVTLSQWRKPLENDMK
jgi:hypothetical protein